MSGRRRHPCIVRHPERVGERDAHRVGGLADHRLHVEKSRHGGGRINGGDIRLLTGRDGRELHIELTGVAGIPPTLGDIAKTVGVERVTVRQRGARSGGECPRICGVNVERDTRAIECVLTAH